MMQRVLQRYGRPSAMFGNPFAAHPQLVRNPFRGCMWVYCGMFCNPFRGVRHAFVERSQRVRFLYVTYSHYKSMVLTCKSMVFGVQKGGF